MRKLVVDEWLTLDGVAQAPGEPKEDTTGGFAYGGWHMNFVDDDFMQWMLNNLHEAGGFVLGRRTYEGFASHWPNATAEEQPVADPLNKSPKYVATRTLSDPLEWQNSTVLNGDLRDAVSALKGKDGGDLHVIGSTELVHSLLERDLVDEFRVIIDPVVVGGGKRVFSEDGTLRSLRLLDSSVTSKGSIIATYGVEHRARTQQTLTSRGWSVEDRRFRDRSRVQTEFLSTPLFDAASAQGFRSVPAGVPPAPIAVRSPLYG